MSDPVSLASLFDAADQAAAGGDFATAARLLAEAARAQEATLGPDHLDLANTLNNLAVAHERSGQLDAAEREYRRAHAIAGRTRPADDPVVTTSAQNLREFCEAHGRPLDGPALLLADDGDPGAAAARAGAMTVPVPADAPTVPIERLAISFASDGSSPAEPSRATAFPATAGRATTSPASTSPATTGRATTSSASATTSSATTSSAAPRSNPPASAPAPRPTPSRAAPAASHAPATAAPARRLPIPLLVALGALVILVIWLFAGRGPGTPATEPQTAAPADPPAIAVPAPVPPSVPSGGATLPAAPGRDTAASAPAPRAAGAPTPRTASTSVDGLTVADAQLCTALSPSYRCDAAGPTVRPGRLVFYTRLVAERDTSVVHRWYRGDDLRQSVRLEVPARRQGFRTFSRGTVSAIEGEWRVELRSRDGRLLHTARVTVR